ncbi:MAG: hypothetical protein EBU97_04685, partial [Rhodobacteraceae bacterium]|nr:hypothetical protein [Paracoccaceae bacterium]
MLDKTRKEANVIDEGFFGYNYTSFRSLGRFENQTSDAHVGMITWPGGYLAEVMTDRYGLEYDDLSNASGKPGLAEMMATARENGAGLSIVLPTARYLGNDAALKADVQRFMYDLLGGHYGELPQEMVLEVGSEYYAAFPKGDASAAEYGHIASQMIEEINRALADPLVNPLHAEVLVGVQSGRSLADDAEIRDHMSEDALSHVDFVIHHRFAPTAEAVDASADYVHQVMDNWQTDVVHAGGSAPDLFLSAYNVASLTRSEALRQYVAQETAQGHAISTSDIDLDGRTDTGFETFWQTKLQGYAYGAEGPRAMLELFSRYSAEGMGAASVYGVDMVHPGRLTTQDGAGQTLHTASQDMMDMLSESVMGTKVINLGAANAAADPVWAYGYENDDKLVVFLASKNTAPGPVTVDMANIGRYAGVWADGLTAKVPQDWMTRFGIADNPNVDETAEAQSYAMGSRSAVATQIDESGVTVKMQANQVIRLAFAKTAAGVDDISHWSAGEQADLSAADDHALHDSAVDDTPHLTAAAC